MDFRPGSDATGEERILLWECICSAILHGRASMICGRSIHNQRIERFWRDVFTSCTSLFYHLFYHMEDTGLLNCDNQIHIWCLHFVYIPYINHALTTFIAAWSNHPMSSMHGMAPLQIWTQGMIILVIGSLKSCVIHSNNM